ncbi:MAG: transcription termination/antitermination protein NusA [Alphaproteobacteria bacterium]|nr:transcription termination/antitermination protein NusA [Alphaproteobacteria bacterium]
MELLHVADAVAREKGIERDEVLEAMEQAYQKAGRAKYGYEHDIRAEIDRRTGEVKLQRFLEVADPIENEFTQITLKAAKKSKADAKIGDFIIDDLPPIDLGRIAAQTAKQVIVQKVREAERRRQYLEYQDRVGEIVSGTVKRVEYGNVTVELGRAEAVLRRDESLPREHFKNGDRVRAYIYDVREEQRGPQIFLSRTHPLFMAKLFAQEVPEIYDGIIEIKSVARDPGSRAKIAVVSNDSSIDPVGACVGMRGSRVQAVVGELQGEKIDIIPWSQDPATFVVNALAPAEVAKVVLDEDDNRMDVVVPDEQLSLAIGRRGQNVRLASMLTGWDIDILTEKEESERRQQELHIRTSLFLEALAVDDVIAHLLVSEGFTKVEQIAETPTDELAEIEGFDVEVAAELQQRARTWLEETAAKVLARRHELGVTDEVVALPNMTNEMAVKLGEKDIKTLDDVADLASDELREILGADQLSEAKANEIIMAARAHWFAEDPNAAPA